MCCATKQIQLPNLNSAHFYNALKAFLTKYMQQILKDSALDEALLTQGFVVVPFLDSRQVQELLHFFEDNHQSAIPGFYATAHCTDIAFRKKMNAQIQTVFAPSIENYFQQCRPLGGSYIVKSSTQEERLHPHQDWSIVDETQHRSFNIWVPLVDLNPQNGAIRVLPGSHMWLENYRGPQIQDSLFESNELIWQHMTTLQMKAGEALIYDHRLYHASYPNQTDDLRIATVFGIIPENAALFYYYGNENSVDVYQSNLEFFMEGDIQKGPTLLKKVKTIEAPLVRINTLPTYLHKQTPTPTFWSKIKRIFNA
jgi:hypothetical protein